MTPQEAEDRKLAEEIAEPVRYHLTEAQYQDYAKTYIPALLTAAFSRVREERDAFKEEANALARCIKPLTDETCKVLRDLGEALAERDAARATLKQGEKIAAFVPGDVWIKAKERAGFATVIRPMAAVAAPAPQRLLVEKPRGAFKDQPDKCPRCGGLGGTHTVRDCKPVQIEMNDNWRSVWHDAPCRGIMQQVTREGGSILLSLRIEDGSMLPLWECLMCGVRVYAGLDKERRIITRLAPDRGEGERCPVCGKEVKPCLACDEGIDVATCTCTDHMHPEARGEGERAEERPDHCPRCGAFPVKVQPDSRDALLEEIELELERLHSRDGRCNTPAACPTAALLSRLRARKG